MSQSYEAAMNAYVVHGPEAIARLIQNYAELFLSVSEEEAAKAIVAVTRLKATQLKAPTSVDECYAILEAILGQLLRDGKLKMKGYGLSTIGDNDLRRLLALPEPPAREPEPSGPAVDFADVLDACRNTSVFNEKMRSDAFRERYQQAVAAGALEAL